MGFSTPATGIYPNEIAKFGGEFVLSGAREIFKKQAKKIHFYGRDANYKKWTNSSPNLAIFLGRIKLRG